MCIGALEQWSMVWHCQSQCSSVFLSCIILCWRVVKRARKRALAEEPGLHLLFFQLIDLPNLTMHVTSAYFCLLSQMLFRWHRFQEFPGHVTDKQNYPLPIWIVICCMSVSVKFVSNSYTQETKCSEQSNKREFTEVAGLHMHNSSIQCTEQSIGQSRRPACGFLELSSVNQWLSGTDAMLVVYEIEIPH